LLKDHKLEEEENALRAVRDLLPLSLL